MVSQSEGDAVDAEYGGGESQKILQELSFEDLKTLNEAIDERRRSVLADSSRALNRYLEQLQIRSNERVTIISPPLLKLFLGVDASNNINHLPILTLLSEVRNHRVIIPLQVLVEAIRPLSGSTNGLSGNNGGEDPVVDRQIEELLESRASRVHCDGTGMVNFAKDIFGRKTRLIIATTSVDLDVGGGTTSGPVANMSPADRSIGQVISSLPDCECRRGVIRFSRRHGEKDPSVAALEDLVDLIVENISVPRIARVLNISPEHQNRETLRRAILIRIRGSWC